MLVGCVNKVGWYGVLMGGVTSACNKDVIGVSLGYVGRVCWLGGCVALAWGWWARELKRNVVPAFINPTY